MMTLHYKKPKPTVNWRVLDPVAWLVILRCVCLHKYHDVITVDGFYKCYYCRFPMCRDSERIILKPFYR